MDKNNKILIVVIAILFIGSILFYNHNNIKTESFIDIVSKPDRYVSLDALDNYGSAEWSEATSGNEDITLSPMYLSNLTNTKDIEEDISPKFVPGNASNFESHDYSGLLSQPSAIQWEANNMKYANGPGGNYSDVELYTTPLAPKDFPCDSYTTTENTGDGKYMSDPKPCELKRKAGDEWVGWGASVKADDAEAKGLVWNSQLGKFVKPSNKSPGYFIV
jgi:hypothetical protein